MTQGISLITDPEFMLMLEHGKEQMLKGGGKVEYKYVCPNCERDDACTMAVKIVEGKRIPYWKCTCGWEGELRKMIAVQSSTPSLGRYMKVRRVPAAPIRAAPAPPLPRPTIQPSVPEVRTIQIRESGPGICTECREIITSFLETKDGYACPTCEAVLFTYEEEDRAMSFLEEGKASQEVQPPENVNSGEVPQLPVCPYCDAPLVKLEGADWYTIEFIDGHWVKEEDKSRITCGNCGEELDHTDIEDIMRAVGLL